jgi:hypothetical protein
MAPIIVTIIMAAIVSAFIATVVVTAVGLRRGDVAKRESPGKNGQSRGKHESFHGDFPYSIAPMTRKVNGRA